MDNQLPSHPFWPTKWQIIKETVKKKVVIVVMAVVKWVQSLRYQLNLNWAAVCLKKKQNNIKQNSKKTFKKKKH